MTPANVKKMVYDVITRLKVEKQWNISDTSNYKKDIGNRALSVTFMHKATNETTKNPYFTLHSNYMGVWFGTFHIDKTGKVHIKSAKLVISPEKVRELSQVEKQIPPERIQYETGNSINRGSDTSEPFISLTAQNVNPVGLTPP